MTFIVTSSQRIPLIIVNVASMTGVVTSVIDSVTSSQGNCQCYLCKTRSRSPTSVHTCRDCASPNWGIYNIGTPPMHISRRNGFQKYMGLLQLFLSIAGLHELAEAMATLYLRLRTYFVYINNRVASVCSADLQEVWHIRLPCCQKWPVVYMQYCQKECTDFHR